MMRTRDIDPPTARHFTPTGAKIIVVMLIVAVVLATCALIGSDGRFGMTGG